MQSKNNINMESYIVDQIQQAKNHFERALECKHTEFDDLYPYMLEHPQFFWYKRYVAWSELLTIVKIANDLQIDWTTEFSPKQVDFIVGRVLHGHILDEWWATISA